MYKGDSPLHMAVRSPEFGVVQLLLKGGADLHVRNMYNLTPFDEAARSRDLEILQLLLSHGAVVDTLNDEGNNPWHEAVPLRNLDAVKHLLKAGAGAVVNTGCHCKPFIDAIVNRMGNVTDTLCQARRSPWQKAVRSPKLCITKLTAVGFVDMDYSPYFISLLNMLSELASLRTSGVCTFGDSNYWSHKSVKRLLVLLVLQWWAVSLRASLKELVGESFEGFFPRFFRKESLDRINNLKYSVVTATFGITLITHVVTYYVVAYQLTLPLTVPSSLTSRILLEILLTLHAWTSLVMGLNRAAWERA